MIQIYDAQETLKDIYSKAQYIPVIKIMQSLKGATMIKFMLNKIGQDKGIESFKSQNIILNYRLLEGAALHDALKAKLIEESVEVQEAKTIAEITEELADLLEVVHGLCKAYEISLQGLEKVRLERYNARGGFEAGFYIESIEMDDHSHHAKHFRASPDKYPEI